VFKKLMLVLCLVDKALICCSGFMKGRTKFVKDVILVNLFEMFCCKLWGFILLIRYLNILWG
jgi:hypothetical protein